MSRDPIQDGVDCQTVRPIQPAEPITDEQRAAVYELANGAAYLGPFFVDAVNGSDDNDGRTPETAWRTVQHAIDNTPVVDGTGWLRGQGSFIVLPDHYRPTYTEGAL